MSRTLLYLVVAGMGFLIGSFPTGVYLSRRKYLIDVREMGSGNIGATNVTRVFGLRAGVFTFALDFLKGFLPLYFLRPLFTEEVWLLPVAGLSLVAGHCFSIYLKFKGGKGVATSFGVVTAIDPYAGLVTGATYLLGILFAKISAVGSLLGLLALCAYTWTVQPETPKMVLYLLLAVLVLARHQSNISRLWAERKTRKSPKPPNP